MIGGGVELPHTYGLKVITVYRGVSTLPEGTMQRQRELLRDYVDTLVRKMLYTYSLFQTKTTIKQYSSLKGLKGDIENIGGVFKYTLPMRIIDDLMVCEVRAWLRARGTPARQYQHLVRGRLREATIRNILTSTLTSRVTRVLSRLDISLLDYRHGMVLRGVPDIITLNPNTVIELTVTPTSRINHILPRVALYAIAISLVYGKHVVPYIISTHDLTLLTIDLTSFNPEAILHYLHRVLSVEYVYALKPNRSVCSRCEYRFVCSRGRYY